MLKSMNSFARLASDRSEVVGGSLVLLMITMMIVPLSPTLLDILISVNICTTVVLVLSAILLDSPLSLSSFPAILLMTTLFRLSLTISTTRQILLEANAGHIIQTFGEFVVGGNVAVGLVIFLIVSVVNFLVVTKGSERVAEVAARFSLDSMPGKQMSIDGDARTGNITQDEAKKKRAELEKESQLFGAMDGAIKFVKNDAIAGLVITFINLLGGLTVGMLQHDLSFSEAGHVYSILSVGDGLVAIIPSLMTSVAAGLIVTRVTKGESDGANTAQDMIRELTGNPKALQISGVFCLIFAFVPGMPTYVFVLVSIALFYKSFAISKPEKEEIIEDPSERFAKMLEGIEEKKGNAVVQDVTSSEIFDPIEVRLPASMEPNAKSLIYSVVKFTRNQIIETYGVLYPLIKFKDDEKINDVEFRIFGVPLLKLKPQDKQLQVYGDVEKIKELADAVELRFDVSLGRHGYFCEPINKVQLDKLGLTYDSFEKRWSLMIENLLISKSKEFFSLNDCLSHLNKLGETYVELIKELSRVMPTPKTVEVLQRLLIEKVSIKNAPMLLASLVEWGTRERDTLMITEQVRKVLYEQISHQYSINDVLYVVGLSNELENFVRENMRSDGVFNFLDVDSGILIKLVNMIRDQFIPFANLKNMPVIICSMDCRPHVRTLIQDVLKTTAVLSFQEISNNREVQFMGTIELDESAFDVTEN